MNLRQIWKLAVSSMLAFAMLASAMHATLAASPKEIILEVFDNPLAIRESPSQSANSLQTLVVGQRFTWDGTTQFSDGRQWMQITTTNGGAGWATPPNSNTYPVDPNRVTDGINIGAVAQVQINVLNLSQSPKFGSPVTARAVAGTNLKVMDGPIMADFYTWWQVQSVGTTPAIQGWIADTATQLKIIRPLQVYGLNVCPGIDIKKYGVPGYDSIIKSLQYFIPVGEKITCIMSANLKGNNTPIVVILARTPGATSNPNDGFDTLRIFDNSSGAWTRIYEAKAQQFSRTEDLRLHDISNDGVPELLWLSRNDGTGGILDIKLLRFAPSTGLQEILATDLYKGLVQVNGNNIVMIQAFLREGEANCCATGLQRTGMTWQTNQLVKAADDIYQSPAFLQGAKK